MEDKNFIKFKEFKKEGARYRLNLRDLYDDDEWPQHIVVGRIYAVRMPACSDVVKLARPERHTTNCLTSKSMPLLIQVTAIDELNAYYKLCDYPGVHEQYFALQSVMAGDLIEIL